MKMDRKFKFFKSKRGISPLIATVLLIAFAVALGAVVMNWGKSYVEDTTKNVEETSDRKLDCSLSVKMAVHQISGANKICFDGDEDVLEVILKNSGTEDIAGIQSTIIGVDNIVDYDNNVSIKSAGLYKLKLSYDPDENGAIEQVVFHPKITVTGTSIPAVCNDMEVKVEEILDC